MAVGATTDHDDVVIHRRQTFVLSESIQETTSTDSQKSRGQTRDRWCWKFTAFSVHIRRNQKPLSPEPEETFRDEVDAVEEPLLSVSILKPPKQNAREKELDAQCSNKDISQGVAQSVNGCLSLPVAIQIPPPLKNVTVEETDSDKVYFPEENMLEMGPVFPAKANINRCRGYKLASLFVFLLLISTARCRSHVSTNQILTQECTSNIYSACLKPDIEKESWEEMNRICCNNFTKKTSIRHFWSCQVGTWPNGTEYIFHACMKNQTAPPGKVLILSVNTTDKTPQYIEQDCQKGSYEDESRNSYMILEPNCRMAQQDCNNSDGKMLGKEGSPSSDNMCKCLPNATYIGDTMAVCEQGFSGNSVCQCEFCEKGFKRNENNTCAQPGQKTSADSSSDIATQNIPQGEPGPTTPTTVSHAKDICCEWWIWVCVIESSILLLVMIIMIISFCSGDKRYFPASQKEEQGIP